MKKINLLMVALVAMHSPAFCIGKFFKDVGKKTKKGFEEGVKGTKKVTKTVERKVVKPVVKTTTTAAKKVEKEVVKPAVQTARKAAEKVEEAFKAQIKLTNDYAPMKSVKVLARRVGCVEVSEKFTLVCKTIDVDYGKTGDLLMRYPYKEGYDLVVLAGDEEWESNKKINDGQTVFFPQDFTFKKLRNSSKYYKVPPRCSAASQCANGYPELWNKRWNEVIEILAHNATARKPGALRVHNQNVPLETILESGAGLHIAIHRTEGKKGELMACHGLYPSNVVKAADKLKGAFDNVVARQLGLDKLYEKAKKEIGTPGVLPSCVFDPAAMPLKDVLAKVRTFLDTHPNNVLAIEFGGPVKDWDAVRDVVKNAGLDRYSYAHNKNAQWPTYGQLIRQQKRLIMFTRGGPYNNANDYVLESNFGFKDIKALKSKDATTYPGKVKNNPLWKGRKDGNVILIVHASLTDPVGGVIDKADTYNARAFVLPHIMNFVKDSDGALPKFYKADFITIGQLQETINQLNGVGKFKNDQIKYPYTKPWYEYPMPN